MTTIMLRRRKLGRGSCRGVSEASTTGITPVRNWVEEDLPEGSVNLTIRWGCTSNAPSRNVLNTAASIHWCSDKRQGRLDMQAAGVPVPGTWDAESFRNMSLYDNDYTGDRFVLRPRTHSQGRYLWHGDMDTVVDAIAHNEVEDGYVSMLVDKVAEYRVAVVQNRVAWVAQKTPGNPDDVAWNVSQGGRFDNVRWGDWPMEVIDAALKAAKVSGTDFCGVDVMVDAEENPYVLEVNSAPSLTSPYRQSCFAKCFDYIVRNGKEPFGDPGYCGWKDVIHPALRG